jgi:putative tryptophan/tyrosine transport system substrate-binding protein
VNRFADEHCDRFDRLTAELLDAKVDIIVASVPSAAISAKRITTAIPVVLAYGGDFQAQGLAQSLSHPGGNITGLSGMVTDLAGKQLEILRDSFANLSAVAVLSNPTTSLSQFAPQAQSAADVLRISVRVVNARSIDDLNQAFSTIANAHADAALLQPDGFLFQQRERIAQLALANRVPIRGWTADMANAGALMSYGADGPDLFRRTGDYIDKILRGANPADLPIQQPTKFEFIVNLKTAKALNLAIPPSVLARADKVIE